MTDILASTRPIAVNPRTRSASSLHGGRRTRRDAVVPESVCLCCAAPAGPGAVIREGETFCSVECSISARFVV